MHVCHQEVMLLMQFVPMAYEGCLYVFALVAQRKSKSVLRTRSGVQIPPRAPNWGRHEEA